MENRKVSNSQGSAPVNAAGEREFLIHALRCATARARLVTNVLETVGVSLRHKAVTTDEAMKWLHDEHVLDYVQIGLPGAAR
jgi:hypothetical protein